MAITLAIPSHENPVGSKPKATPTLFQAEPEEFSGPSRKSASSSSSRRLFAPEPDEATSSSETESNDEGGKNGEPASVFNFGWRSIATCSKVNLTRDIGHQPEKVKRPYDNSKRHAKAEYKRSASKSFQENGLSQERVLKVLAQDSCLCA